MVQLECKLLVASGHLSVLYSYSADLTVLRCIGLYFDLVYG